VKVKMADQENHENNDEMMYDQEVNGNGAGDGYMNQESNEEFHQGTNGSSENAGRDDDR
jgi:hypothetical protein